MVGARVHCTVPCNTGPSFVSIVCAEFAGQDGSSTDGCVLSWKDGRMVRARMGVGRAGMGRAETESSTDVVQPRLPQSSL
jgi:hypothetical protein